MNNRPPRKPRASDLLPPRLSMDEYAAFIDWSVAHRDPSRAVRQKEMEEQVRRRFALVETRRGSCRSGGCMPGQGRVEQKGAKNAKGGMRAEP